MEELDSNSVTEGEMTPSLHGLTTTTIQEPAHHHQKQMATSSEDSVITYLLTTTTVSNGQLGTLLQPDNQSQLSMGLIPTHHQQQHVSHTPTPGAHNGTIITVSIPPGPANHTHHAHTHTHPHAHTHTHTHHSQHHHHHHQSTQLPSTIVNHMISNGINVNGSQILTKTD